MLTDISIVVWKEWKELLQFQSGKRSSLTGLIIMVLIFGKPRFYKPEIFFSGMILSFLLVCLMSVIGVLVSLGAASVKQAQLTLGVSVFILAYVIPMIGVYLLRFVPEEIKNILFQPILTVDIASLVIYAAVILILFCLGLYLAAQARFQWARLILD